MQALVLLPDKPIALTGFVFQSALLENAYAAAAIADQVGRLKLVRRLRNARTAHAQ